MNKLVRTYSITTAVILLPMVYGLAVYNQLPARMATHFGIDNTPNGFMTKPIAVIGLPIMMLLLQALCLGATSWQHKPVPARFMAVVQWLIPVLSGVVYISTIRYNLGDQVNIWRIACTLMAFIFIAMGNYLPTLTETSSINLAGRHPSAAAWRKIRRPLGYTMVGGGILLLGSLLVNPIVSVVVLGLTIIGILTLTIWGGTRR